MTYTIRPDDFTRGSERRSPGLTRRAGVRSPYITGWERTYRLSAVLADTLACVSVVTLFAVTGFGADAATRYAPVGVAVLLASLAIARAWQPTVLGQGADEFRRLGTALFTALVIFGGLGLAIGGPVVDVTTARAWTFGVLPGTALLVVPARYLLRRRLHRARSRGRCLLPVMAAGNTAAISDLILRCRAAPHIGWRVEAVCTGPGTAVGSGCAAVAEVPVIGTLAEVADRVRHGGYRILAVAPDPYWTPRRLQRLAWELENTATEMVFAPTLLDVTGPRLHMSGVFGMPMLRVSAPSFTGARRLVKGAVDRIGAALLLVLSAPLLLGIAVTIRIADRGPALYHQRRVGKLGRGFTVLKFRTMIADAEHQMEGLRRHSDGAGPLFKMRRDPRVTRVGAVLRRYSMDELPQLLNVLTGTMSLVGPRPPLPEECERYGHDARRRLLVKPGLTGLWQVSGRSDLTWDESVRLDLRYVEDWSLALDAVILWKTLNAVIRGRGAY